MVTHHCGQQALMATRGWLNFPWQQCHLLLTKPLTDFLSFSWIFLARGVA